MNEFTHLDLTTTGEPTSEQLLAIKTLCTHKDLTGVSIYLNSEFIGGRPNDRS